MIHLGKTLRLIAFLLLLPVSAGAMDLTVTRTDDPAPNGCQPGDCSLREAVMVANALPGTDRIVLPAGLYQLTIAGIAADDASVGDLDIGGDVEIVGAGAATTTVLVVNNNRIFSASGHSFTLKKLTLAGGRADNGGAILTDGPLIIEDAILSGNQVTGSGGAIFGGTAEIVLRRVQLSNNTATDFGGAVSAGSGGVLVVDTTISDNTASSADGGGIYSGGPTRIYRSVIKNNHAPNYYGGGVACETLATLEIHESTISGNSAFVGGGIYATYPVLIDRSTLSGNTASASGGGIVFANGTYGVGTALISSSTLYLNTAGLGSAIFFQDEKQELPVPVITNTVISGTCTGSGRGFLAPIGNIESPGNTCGLGGGHDVAAVDLKLGALGDNGGPTPTHLPLAGSAVLGAAQNCASYDQRGYGLTSIAVCDSGSVWASAVDDSVFRYGFDF